jgi:hypothetical protein
MASAKLREGYGRTKEETDRLYGGADPEDHESNLISRDSVQLEGSEFYVRAPVAQHAPRFLRTLLPAAFAQPATGT